MPYVRSTYAGEFPNRVAPAARRRTHTMTDVPIPGDYRFDREDYIGRTKEERKETTDMDSIAMMTMLRRSR